MADITNSKPATGGTSMNIGKILLEGRAFFALVAIIIAFSILSPVYFSVGNFLIMSSHVAIFGLLAIGMLLVILNGGIDLSVGSTLGLSGVVAGYLMQGVEIPAAGVILYPPVWAVVLLTICLGAFVGAINGVLIAFFNVPAFVATLGMLSKLGLVRTITGLLRKGVLESAIGRRYALEDVKAAVTEAEQSGSGKVLLDIAKE